MIIDNDGNNSHRCCSSSAVICRPRRRGRLGLTHNSVRSAQLLLVGFSRVKRTLSELINSDISRHYFTSSLKKLRHSLFIVRSLNRRLWELCLKGALQISWLINWLYVAPRTTPASQGYCYNLLLLLTTTSKCLCSGKYRDNELITQLASDKSGSGMFAMRTRKLRERVDNAVTQANQAAHSAMQKTDIATAR